MQEPIHEISIPVGTMSLIGMKGCEEITAKVDKYLVDWRSQRHGEMMNDADFIGYCRDTYQLQAECPRFGTGEAKGTLKESVRGHDLYILSDVFNYGVTYKMYGMNVPMSPDDHYQDLKRIIAAVSGKARRINVIMPMLYEGRQHRRTSRESLDCALCLQELAGMGVENLITFDAHDPRVQNAVPLKGFENVHPTYQFLKAMVNTVPDISFDRDHLMLISPDELKKMGARRIFVFASFGLFCEGLEKFDAAYEKGEIYRVFTTNLIYRTPELLKREWYTSVDLSKYIAYIVDTLNHDQSISNLLNPVYRINKLLERKRTEEQKK